MRGYGAGSKRHVQASARPEPPVRPAHPNRQANRVQRLLRKLSRGDLLRSGLVGALFVGALAPLSSCAGDCGLLHA